MRERILPLFSPFEEFWLRLAEKPHLQAGLGHLRKRPATFGPPYPLTVFGNTRRATPPLSAAHDGCPRPRWPPDQRRPGAFAATVALHFARGDQLTAGLAPAKVRPCREHKKARASRAPGKAEESQSDLRRLATPAAASAMPTRASEAGSGIPGGGVAEYV